EGGERRIQAETVSKPSVDGALEARIGVRLGEAHGAASLASAAVGAPVSRRLQCPPVRVLLAPADQSPGESSSIVVTKKIARPTSRGVERRGRTSALNAPRRRVHALAPEHVGELGSVAALAVAVLGFAIVMVGVTLIVEGVTIASRYDTGTGSPPPNLGQLGQLPIFGGIG